MLEVQENWRIAPIRDEIPIYTHLGYCEGETTYRVLVFRLLGNMKLKKLHLIKKYLFDVVQALTYQNYIGLQFLGKNMTYT